MQSYWMGNGTCTGISVLQIALPLKMQKHVSHDLRYVAVIQLRDCVSTYKENKVRIVLSTSDSVSAYADKPLSLSINPCNGVKRSIL